MSIRFDNDFSTASRPRSPSADTAPAPSPISSGTPAHPSARSTTSSPARSSASSSCCTPTSENWAKTFASAVDPDAEWQTQIRQAVEAYVGHIESRPALTLSWIRELPSLDAAARPFQRRGMQLLTSLLMNLSGSSGFVKAGLPPLTQAKAVILVGGLRELTALAVEDGHTMREIVEPAVQASVAMLGYRH